MVRTIVISAHGLQIDYEYVIIPNKFRLRPFSKYGTATKQNNILDSYFLNSQENREKYFNRQFKQVFNEEIEEKLIRDIGQDKYDRAKMAEQIFDINTERTQREIDINREKIEEYRERINLILTNRKYQSNINGTRTVQEVIDENHYVITAGANANASVDGGGAPRITTHAPTTNWDEQSFSSYRGYPAAVTFHENRLWFGGTIGQPDGIWASRSNEYFNFNTVVL